MALAATGVAIMAACSGATEPTGHFVDIDEAEWGYGQTLTFPALTDSAFASAPDSSRVVVAVRHTNDYEYANLWLELGYRAGDSTVTDTFDIRLSDEFGKWLGNGTGVTVLRADTVTLSRPRDPRAEMTVRHVMRVDTLAGVEQIGLLPVVGGK